MKLTFVESAWFTKRLKSRMDDDSYRVIQMQLVRNPERGAVMPGCGGLRKLRFPDPSRGKGTRGGMRLIYLHIPEAFRIDFFDIYGKDEKDDLSAKEKSVLAELSAKVRQEAIAAFNRGGGRQ